MKCWQAEQLRLLSSTGSTEETFQAILAEVNRLGFFYCSFGLKAPTPLIAPRVLWCNNYPAAWQERYEKQDYVRRDPTVRHAIMSDVPLLWSDELFADSRQLREEAQSFGLNHGWAQPRRDVHGFVSLLSCVRSEPEITREEIQSKSERIQWLAYLCHEGMLKHWGQKLLGSREALLSEREAEILRWSCDGKTSADTAQLLGLSEATINFHLRNVCSKLGTSNRTAAAVQAALMGLLW